MIFTEAAPAKLNLAFHVRRRRPDGYHDVESLFAFTEFGDTLTAEPADTVSLSGDGEFAGTMGSDADNLVLRAARALAAAAAVTGGARLHLTKRIPVAAGLGGGSADAAAALRLLNRMWGIDWPEARLAELARPLGADVPACVLSRACRGSGKGDELVPWTGAPVATPVLLVNPRVAVSTPPVFAGWDGRDRGGIASDGDLATQRNDLTGPAVALAPQIADVLADLVAAGGATLVRMSGSGATCFAVYPAVEARDAALERLQEQEVDRRWWFQPTTLI